MRIPGSQHLEMFRLKAFSFPGAMFCLGFFAVMAQVVFIRELFVVFLGNELSIGAALACWFTGIGAGAVSSELGARFRPVRSSAKRLLCALLVVMAVLLPVQVYGIRIARLILSVPVGEYAPLGKLIGFAFLIFLPTSLGVGLIFPFACEAGAPSRRTSNRDSGDKERRSGMRSVSVLYVAEAFGSMTGGVILTFILLPLVSPYVTILFAMGVGMLGAAFVAPRRIHGGICALAALFALVLAAVQPGWLAKAGQWTVSQRWESFGIVSGGEDDRQGRPKLVSSKNSVYQNLTMTKAYGQFVLYANGQILFVFPDEYEYEHEACFILSQRPSAKRVLMLGGNPVGLVPELLELGIEDITCVRLDPAVTEIIEEVIPGKYGRIACDSRVSMISGDASLFVKRYDRRFDMVILEAPDPGTLAANRFYTPAFYRDIQALLADGGIFYTAVDSAVRLRSAIVERNASVYKSLKEVFENVLVTAGDENRFIAGAENSSISLDRQTLFNRAQQFSSMADYFKPEFFLVSEIINPEKVDYVIERFKESDIRANTHLNPVTYFFSLLLWSRYSNSGLEEPLTAMRSLDFRSIVQPLIAGGILCIAVGLLFRKRGNKGGQRGGDLWSRCMTVLLVGTTGFAGIAMEIILLFVFQTLYGYVYTRIGLVAAMFMLGLVVGGMSGRRIATRTGRKGVFVALCLCEALFLVGSAAVPGLVRIATAIDTVEILYVVEVAVYMAVALIGALVGFEFPSANAFFLSSGGRIRTSAAITDAFDHIGSAVGCIAVGVILLPVLGIGASCMVLAALKAAGLMFVVSAGIAGKR